MTDKLKKIAIASLFTGLAFSVCATAFGSDSSLFARAASFVGNHYTAREATFTQSGCCEYWIDCNTHEVFFTNPGGQITEAGEAYVVVLPNDDRYVAPISNTQMSEDGKESISTQIDTVHIDDKTPGGKKDDEDIFVVDSNGNETGLIIEPTSDDSEDYQVTGWEGTGKTIIVPEGVVDLNTWNNGSHGGNPFDGSLFPALEQVETIVIPSTVEELVVTNFINLPNLKTLIINAKKINFGFVQKCPKLTSVYLGSGVQNVQGQAFNQYSGSQSDPNHLVIGCELTEAQIASRKYSSDWNRITWNGNNKWFETHYGVTL